MENFKPGEKFKSRKVTITDKFKAQCIDVEAETPNMEGRIVVKQKLSLISPGTELAFFEGIHTDIVTGHRKYPVGGGYSSVGEVVQIGSGVKGIKEGDKVFAMFGHGSIGFPAVFHKLPEGLDERNAVFTTLASIALHAVRQANPQFGQNILVMGLGAIGQVTVKLLKLSPAAIIAGADTYSFRLQKGIENGCNATLNVKEDGFEDKLHDITSGKGFDIVIDATGKHPAIQTALRHVAKCGKFIILGCPHGNITLDLYSTLQKNEISLIGSYQPNCPEQGNVYFPWTQSMNRQVLIDYMHSGRLNFSHLLTHLGKPEHAQEFYDMLSKEKDKCITAAFKW